MRTCLVFFSILVLPVFAVAQQNIYWEEWSPKQIDSLQSAWKTVADDTSRLAISRSLGFYYQEKNRDSSLYFNEQQLSLARKLKQRLWEGDALDQMGYVLSQTKNYARSLESFLEGIKILEDEQSEKNIWRISIFSLHGDARIARLTALGYIRNDISRLYEGTGNIEKALSGHSEALQIGEGIKNYSMLSLSNMNLSSLYLNLNKLDSALNYAKNGLKYADQSNFLKYRGYALSIVGNIYFKRGNIDSAKKYLLESIRASEQQSNTTDLGVTLLGVANLYITLGQQDSALWHARRGLETLRSANSPDNMVTAYMLLSSIFQVQHKFDSAFTYQRLAMKEKENLTNLEKINQFQNIGLNEQKRVQQLEIEKRKVQDRFRTYGLLSGLGVIFVVALLLYRNNRQKQKANSLLAKQKEEVQETLSKLRSTQAQLIQSEKMASLGELTAGIAHEIQNPLNFVNNFSDVNNELLAEMKDEMDNGNLAGARSIADNILDNQVKIVHHGRRADSIVKGMLQHSRVSAGQKQPTDINALADEYLRLSYHGLRAKDQSFNTEMQTHFDPAIGKIDIIPQDIGRVLLNLFNNAFYALSAFAKASADKSAQSNGNYKPLVTVTTKRLDNKIEIRVRDNGMGVPENLKDKIFQPFFTTKPTGQGTGLGLSLSYDIIKAHGGDIKVESKEGEGSEFTIQLPV